jgi:hypothetical protein
MRQTSFRLPDDLHDALIELAAGLGSSMTALVVRYCREGMARDLAFQSQLRQQIKAAVDAREIPAPPRRQP